MRIYGAQGGTGTVLHRPPPRGSKVFSLQYYSPTLHTRNFFTHHRRYIIIATDSVFINITPFSVTSTSGYAQTSINATHCPLKAKTWPARIPGLTPLPYMRGYVKRMALNVEIDNTNYLWAESKLKM